MTKKMIAIVAAVILVIGISAGTTMLVGKKEVPVSTKVENGLSAYELAVQFGYEGTVQEWLESLEGKSAYQIAVDSGYKGTESEWIASLKATADNTADIKNAQFNSKGELILTLSDDTSINLGVAVGTNGKDGAAGKNGADGKDGKDGQNGTPGKDGVDGKDGISISEASINNEGQLILTFTDGKAFNLDKVVGAKGEAGIGIANSKINEQGELVLTYSNGQEANLGKVLGAAGNDGQDGTPGKDGNAIISTVINNSGELVVTYSNGTSDNLGVVVGRDGKDGADGKDGVNGTDGRDGQDGADGKDGVNGTNGKDGVDGKDGVGVSSAQINSKGELVLTYSNGQISTLGKVIGADGKDGVNGADGKDGLNGTNGKDGVDGKDGISISKSEINSNGELVITYSNNEVENLGVVVGSKGTDGKDGVNGLDGKDGKAGVAGKDGVGIGDIKIENDNLFITLTNGTTMNLGNIKGADGKDGQNGADGKDGKDGQDGAPGKDGIDGKHGISVSGAEINAANELVLTFSDGTDKNLGVVVGKDGQNGADGKDGINGTNGADGKDGRGIKKTEINAIGELVVTYTDDTTDNLGVIISDNGGAGTGAIAPRIQINSSTNEWEISTDGGNTYVSTGVKATGADGKDGANGTDGKDGANGISVTGATINDEKELILTFSDGAEKNLGVVVGADGKDGQDGANGKDGINGTNGVDGKDGKDGEKGEDGADGKDGVGISGAAIETNNHLILTLSNGDTIDVGVVVGADGKDGQDGANGKDGINGTNGADGKDGKDGVGIKNVTVSEEGILTITLDNDTIFTLGNIKGKDGVGIAKTEINAEGKLVIIYTDNKVVTLDKVVGADGIGIKTAEITEDYMLKLTFTDNGTQVLGPIRGEKGADGVGIKNVSVGYDGYLYVTYSNSDEAQKIAYIKGDKGDKGEKGDAGVDGETPYILNGTWWIGETNTGIKAEGTDGTNGTNGTNGADGKDGKDGVGIQNAYINSESHLIIVLTNGTEIDAGKVSSSGSSVPLEKFTVTFKDHDGTVLKKEEVESGQSATAPANPSRTGYIFTGWNQPFNNVISDMVVIAQYQKITAPTLVVGNVTTTAGSTNVEVLVEAQNNPGIAGMTLGVEYDESVLTLTKVSSQEVLSGLSFQKPKTYKSGCNLVWYGTEPDEVIDGTAFKLVFTIDSSAQSGTYPITLTYSTGYDANLGSIEMTVINGSIVIN